MAAAVEELTLADIIRDIGFKFTASTEECKNYIVSSSAREITAIDVARIISKMIQYQVNFQGGPQVETTRSLLMCHAKDNVKDKWNAEVFVQALHELVCDLNWEQVITKLDHKEFVVPDRAALNLLFTILRLGLQCAGYPDNMFPTQYLCKRWKNLEGQMSLICNILNNPDIFRFADYPDQHAPIEMLKALPNIDYSIIDTWRNTSLVDVLLYASERGLVQVTEVFKTPIIICPDVLLIVLLQIIVPMTSVRQELLTTLIHVVLGKSMNSQIVLRQAWATHKLRPIIMHGMIDYYFRGDCDCSKLIQILRVALDLNCLMLLLNIQSFPFVIDLACLASSKSHLKLDKWLLYKTQKYGEAFLAAMVKLLQRRCPMISNKEQEVQLKGAHLQYSTINKMLACLRMHMPKVQQELQEAISYMIANSQAMTSSNGQTMINLPSVPSTNKKCDILQAIITEDYHPCLYRYLKRLRAATENNHHQLECNLIDFLKLSNLERQIIGNIYCQIKKLLHCNKEKREWHRKVLHNLGQRLRILILERKPILFDDVKALLLQAYNNGPEELRNMMYFVVKVLEHSAENGTFVSLQPRTMTLTNVLAELYQEPDLTLNVMFEMDTLCNKLRLNIANLKSGIYMRNPKKIKKFQFSQPNQHQQQLLQEEDQLQEEKLLQDVVVALLHQQQLLQEEEHSQEEDLMHDVAVALLHQQQLLQEEEQLDDFVVAFLHQQQLLQEEKQLHENELIQEEEQRQEDKLLHDVAVALQHQQQQLQEEEQLDDVAVTLQHQQQLLQEEEQLDDVAVALQHQQQLLQEEEQLDDVAVTLQHQQQLLQEEEQLDDVAVTLQHQQQLLQEEEQLDDVAVALQHQQQLLQEEEQLDDVAVTLQHQQQLLQEEEQLDDVAVALQHQQQLLQEEEQLDDVAVTLQHQQQLLQEEEQLDDVAVALQHQQQLLQEEEQLDDVAVTLQHQQQLLQEEEQLDDVAVTLQHQQQQLQEEEQLDDVAVALQHQQQLLQEEEQLDDVAVTLQHQQQLLQEEEQLDDVAVALQHQQQLLQEEEQLDDVAVTLQHQQQQLQEEEQLDDVAVTLQHQQQLLQEEEQLDDVAVTLQHQQQLLQEEEQLDDVAVTLQHQQQLLQEEEQLDDVAVALQHQQQQLQEEEQLDDVAVALLHQKKVVGECGFQIRLL